MLKSLARALLRRRGLELKLVGAPVRGPDNYIRRLKAKGFRPGTVIDIAYMDIAFTRTDAAAIPFQAGVEEADLTTSSAAAA